MYINKMDHLNIINASYIKELTRVEELKAIEKEKLNEVFLRVI